MPYAANAITPYLLYADLESAIEWLHKAFGLREILRHDGANKKAVHAEMALGETGIVLMGWPGPSYRNPKQLGQVTQHLYVRVDDVDALFKRATHAGATVLEQPADQSYGDRRCGLEDPEGHRWYFAQPIARS